MRDATAGGAGRRTAPTRPAPGGAGRLAASVALLLVVSAVPCLDAGSGAPIRLEVSLPPHGTLRWDRGREPVVMVLPHAGDGWVSLTRRLCGASVTADSLRAANPGVSEPRMAQELAVPLASLEPGLRLIAARALFPADRRGELGWEHRVLDPFGGGEESWEWLAELFAGRSAASEPLRRANPELAGSPPRRGRLVTVPETLLLPVFRRVTLAVTPTATPTAAPSPTPTATPTATPVPSATPTPVPSATPTPPRSPQPVEAPTPPATTNGTLTYGSDAEGEYAQYRLRRGEALYSAVVVRFTGQLQADDVNATAALLARRSGIADVTSIPVGYPVKIPLELLLPQHLPPSDPRRRAWEREQGELSSLLEVVRASDLSGVQVVLDAGHGGRDTGAVADGVWESPYVYDILCRVKANLEKHTKATVWTTIKDASRGYTIPDRDVLKQDRDQSLLSHPPYRLGDSVVGVHLRWYLANDIFLHRLGGEVPRSMMVFLSIHADSLHPSLRGAMVYVPARSLRPSSQQVNVAGITGFEEYRRGPRVELDGEFRGRAEASSARLAAKLVEAIGRGGMALHPYQPVRDRVLRGQRGFVPAVLRYSVAQNAVLLECCNLANADDRKLMLSRDWRERFARAVVAGLAATFSAEQ